MSDIASPSAVLGQVTKFWRIMETAGMTPQHFQRVIDRPDLRKDIVMLVTNDMVRLWQPDTNYPPVPTNLHLLTVPLSAKPILTFEWLDGGMPMLAQQLDAVIAGFEGRVSHEEIAKRLYKIRDPFPLLYFYGLIGARKVSLEELASGYDVKVSTIRNRIKRARHQLARNAYNLLEKDYAPAELLKAGLVSAEWAAATDDVRVLGLSKNTQFFIGNVVLNMPEAEHLTRISQLTSLTEAQLRAADPVWLMHMDDVDPVEEIKAKLAEFGLSLVES